MNRQGQSRHSWNQSGNGTSRLEAGEKRRRCWFIPVLLLFCLGTVWGDAERPNEDSLFGGTSPAPAPEGVTQSAATPEQRDSQELTPSQPGPDDFATGAVADNALQIGGVLYQRMVISSQTGVSASDTPFSLPLQFDAFMDARPNDRVRAYVDGRLMYDSTRDAYSNSTHGSNGALPSLGSFTASPSLPNNPQTVLDQAWLKFDLERTVFLTMGKQHVKWGASRYWNPTDFLNSQKRDPLLPYDLRLGTTMLKVDVPWETKKANFSALALFDDPQPSSTLGQVGGAFRAEAVLWDAEVGLDAVMRDGRTPVYGADISGPLGPLDAYAEAACYSEAAGPVYQILASPTAGADLSSLVTSSIPLGPQVQASAGLDYSFAWKENRQADLGAEYFFNQTGYTDPRVYPALIFYGQYQPLYLGRQYAAVYLTAEGPDEAKNTSYTFSTLGNLSDGSVLSRVDFSWTMLTYLVFQCYVDGHYGAPNGEFDFSLDTPPLTYLSNIVPAAHLPAPICDFGASLRLAF